MRMDAAQSAKSTRRDAHAFEVRKLDAFVITDHHVLNVALAIDESTDLATCFMRELAQLASEFMCDNLVWRYAPGVQLFDSPQLVWF